MVQIKMKIRNHIQELLDRDGISQAELSRRIDPSSRAQVGRWCKNEEQPHIGYVLRIHQCMGWSLEEMFEEYLDKMKEEKR